MAIVTSTLSRPSVSKTPSGLIGRDAIVASITTAVEQGRSVALVGPSGIGKTAILSAIRRSSRLTHVALYSAASTFKSALTGIAKELCAASPPEQRVRPPASLSHLRRFVRGHLKQGRHVLLVDHTGHLSLRAADFFDRYTGPAFHSSWRSRRSIPP